jgi:hypothetical protein
VLGAPAGTIVVRAMELGGGGLPLPYRDQSVQVRSAQTTEVGFVDCTICVSPSR